MWLAIHNSGWIKAQTSVGHGWSICSPESEYSSCSFDARVEPFNHPLSLDWWYIWPYIHSTYYQLCVYIYIYTVYWPCSLYLTHTHLQQPLFHHSFHCHWVSEELCLWGLVILARSVCSSGKLTLETGWFGLPLIIYLLGGSPSFFHQWMGRQDVRTWLWRHQIDWGLR